jgi:succinate dehydrogenase/fumarate reductase cytochrome b subunit
MALTGLACVGFLFGHAIGNLQYFLGSDTYNSYAYFLQSLGEILWIIRFGLIGCILLHIISAVYLRIHNNAAKPIGYQVKNYAKAKLTSRTMLWTGLLICSGLTFHLLHFTVGAIDFENGYNQEEIYPTGTFVVGAGCSDTDAKGCNMDNGKCPDCKEGGNTCQMESNLCSMEGASIDKEEERNALRERFMAKAMEQEGEQSCCATDAQANADKPCQMAGHSENCDKPCCKEGGNKGECSVADKKCETSENVSCCESQTNVYDKAKPGEVIKPRHDVYAMVTAEFSNIFVALSYIIFVCLVGFHLNHAIQSAIHTIGIEGPKFTPFMRIASTCLSIILILLFITLPLGILAKTYLGCIVGGLF